MLILESILLNIKYVANLIINKMVLPRAKIMLTRFFLYSSRIHTICNILYTYIYFKVDNKSRIIKILNC